LREQGEDRGAQAGGGAVGVDVRRAVVVRDDLVVDVLGDVGGGYLGDLPERGDDMLVAGELQRGSQGDVFVGDCGSTSVGFAGPSLSNSLETQELTKSL
jgi:hypothetical protein